MQINPAVLAAAERFTDGFITSQVLADVAAMKALTLHVETLRGAEELHELIAIARMNYCHAVKMQGWALGHCSKARRPGMEWAAKGARRQLGDANRARAAACRALCRLEAELVDVLAFLALPMAA